MRRLRAKRIRRLDEPQANPMDGTSNLADAMLVLAVGIMLALIINWRVDISTKTTGDGDGDGLPLAALDLSPDNVTSVEGGVESDALRRIGSLYYDDATGTYYAVADEQSTGAPLQSDPDPASDPASQGDSNTDGGLNSLYPGDNTQDNTQAQDYNPPTVDDQAPVSFP